MVETSDPLNNPLSNRRPDQNSPRERQLAALDLGSNSFHLLVAQESNNRIQVVDKMKEMVRLADGLGKNKPLNPDVRKRALECLDRFSQRLRGLAPEDVRVVGTDALRKAANAREFLDDAERILGSKVEIISGREEARLIYLGVSHALEDTADRRLVVDIGGGSTEIVLGRQFRAELMESLSMGCVGVTNSFFDDGKLSPGQFKKAINLAKQELEPLSKVYREAGWDTSIGASGTILAVQDILNAQSADQTTITLAGLDSIKKALIDSKTIDKIDLPGLPLERAPVFAGGLAVLQGIFDALGIEEMQATNGALREGLLYDLLGRVHDQDVRENTVQSLAQRYHIDQGHARQVRETAISLLAQTALDWKLTDPTDKLLLSWASDLHEIGMDISHSRYHKHGGYLLEHMDMPGFSRQDQIDLATLVRVHRRKLPVGEIDISERIQRLAVLLRISVVLHRSRTTEPLPHVNVHVKDRKVRLDFPDDWLAGYPLTELDLTQEAQNLKEVEISLNIVAG
jgi:exopolyphosphatase/guanosine-5'-triphosphate,3'-diphosphate pyrophosphatase